MIEDPGLLNIKLAGDRDILVYPKPDFQPATYTVLNFPVDDVEATVDGLSDRGVAFERYEGMEQDEKGIAQAPAPKSPGSRTRRGTSWRCWRARARARSRRRSAGRWL